MLKTDECLLRYWKKQNGTINCFSADLNDCLFSFCGLIVVCIVPCDCVSGDLLSYSDTRLVFH